MSDVAILRWTYKRSREIARRLPAYRGPVPGAHPQFPEGSDAIMTAETSPVDISASNINYTAADDAAIDHYHRNTGTHLYFVISEYLLISIHSGYFLALGKSHS